MSVSFNKNVMVWFCGQFQQNHIWDSEYQADQLDLKSKVAQSKQLNKNRGIKIAFRSIQYISLRPHNI